MRKSNKRFFAIVSTGTGSLEGLGTRVGVGSVVWNILHSSSSVLSSAVRMWPVVFSVYPLLFLARNAHASDVPVGHLRPLGHHRPADGTVDSYENVISPREFWDKYASKRKPVVFRGAANRSDAIRLWTNDYLTEHYGRLEVKMEGKREKLGKMPVGEKGVGRDTIGNFLKT